MTLQSHEGAPKYRSRTLFALTAMLAWLELSAEASTATISAHWENVGQSVRVVNDSAELVVQQGKHGSGR